MPEPLTSGMPPPLAVTLPSTEYFEIDSAAAGDRFAVWVTRPVDYDRGGEACYPAIYVTDGNVSAAMLSPYAEHTAFDLIGAFQPYLQVTVGYPPDKAADWLTLRNRDLVPDDEPAPPSMIAAVAADAETAGWTQEEHDEYLRSIREGRAAQFLAFLEDELRPVIEDRYRVAPEGTGLFGYSYGGLFSLYALMRQSPMFRRYGAGSPGVLSADSQIFRLEDGIARRGQAFGDVRLHLTVNELEITGRSHIYRDLGIQFARLVDRLYLSDHQGLDFAARILPSDTHMTGFTQSFLSYLRACYGASVPRGGGL
jgi:predicted alpha/beta superfamily hydrolase